MANQVGGAKKRGSKKGSKAGSKTKKGSKRVKKGSKKQVGGANCIRCGSGNVGVEPRGAEQWYRCYDCGQAWNPEDMSGGKRKRGSKKGSKKGTKKGSKKASKK